ADSISALRRYCRQVEVVPIGRLRWLRALGGWLCGRTLTQGAFSSPALRATLRRWASATQFHATLASASSMIPYLRLPELCDVPAVVDLVDVDSQKWYDYAAAGYWPKSWLYRIEGRRLRRLESRVPDWARAATLTTAAEVALFRSFCPSGTVHVLENGVDLDYFQPHPAALEPAVTFVGQLDYRPNVEGI